MVRWVCVHSGYYADSLAADYVWSRNWRVPRFLHDKTPFVEYVAVVTPILLCVCVIYYNFERVLRLNMD